MADIIIPCYIHCTTREEVDDVLDLLGELGYLWNDDSDPRNADGYPRRRAYEMLENHNNNCCIKVNTWEKLTVGGGASSVQTYVYAARNFLKGFEDYADVELDMGNVKQLF